MSELVKIQTQNSQVQITEISLQIPENLTVDEWAELGIKVGGLHKSIQWIVGDYLLYGENRYGDSFSQVAEELSLAPETLRNNMYVARKWPIERRNPNVTFGHHQVLAAMEPEHADILIKQAEEKNMTCTQLKEIRKAYNSGAIEEDEGELVICCPNCSLELDHIGIYNKVKRYIE